MLNCPKQHSPESMCPKQQTRYHTFKNPYTPRYSHTTHSSLLGLHHDRMSRCPAKDRYRSWGTALSGKRTQAVDFQYLPSPFLYFGGFYDDTGFTRFASFHRLGTQSRMLDFGSGPAGPSADGVAPLRNTIVV